MNIRLTQRRCENPRRDVVLGVQPGVSDRSGEGPQKEAPDDSRAELRRETLELKRKRPAVVPALSVSI